MDGHTPSLIKTDSQGSRNDTDLKQKQIVSKAFLLNNVVLSTEPIISGMQFGSHPRLLDEPKYHARYQVTFRKCVKSRGVAFGLKGERGLNLHGKPDIFHTHRLNKTKHTQQSNKTITRLCVTLLNAKGFLLKTCKELPYVV